MAKLERKMEITLPLPEQKFRRFADPWSGLKCGHTMARRSAQSNALGSAGSELINLPGGPLGCLHMGTRSHLRPRPFGNECGMRAGAA